MQQSKRTIATNRSASNMQSKGKITLMLLLAVMLVTTACGGNGNTNNGTATNGGEDGTGKLSVVTSFYPLYYLAQEIGGEHVTVKNLIPTGVEPHDWTPKSKDLTSASRADIFLYNGAGLEGWVDEFLEGLDKDSGVKTVEASHGVELISGDPHDHAHDEEEAHAEEAHAEEAQAEEAHAEEAHAEEAHAEEAHAEEAHAEEAHADEHAHTDEEAHAEEEGHDADHAHEEGVDPHTWMSPKSMLIMAANVRDSLIEADEANRAAFEAGYASVEQSLKELDAAYEELRTLPRHDIVVSHQAFGYLCRDYGLNQVAIMGLSAEAEPKAQDLLDITRFVVENDIRYIFFEELVSSELAETLANEADVDTLVLNPVEGLTPEQEAKGDNYVTLMETNLQNLRQALQ